MVSWPDELVENISRKANNNFLFTKESLAFKTAFKGLLPAGYLVPVEQMAILLGKHVARSEEH